MKGYDMQWILVDCISQYRMRYMVQVPDGQAHWALDTVALEEAKEFSQEWLGETVVSHRVITEDDAIKLFKEDNSYLSSWTDEKIKEGFFTSYEEKND